MDAGIRDSCAWAFCRINVLSFIDFPYIFSKIVVLRDLFVLFRWSIIHFIVWYHTNGSITKKTYIWLILIILLCHLGKFWIFSRIENVLNHNENCQSDKKIDIAFIRVERGPENWHRYTKATLWHKYRVTFGSETVTFWKPTLRAVSGALFYFKYKFVRMFCDSNVRDVRWRVAYAAVLRIFKSISLLRAKTTDLTLMEFEKSMWTVFLVLFEFDLF